MNRLNKKAAILSVLISFSFISHIHAMEPIISTYEEYNQAKNELDQKFNKNQFRFTMPEKRGQKAEWGGLLDQGELLNTIRFLLETNDSRYKQDRSYFAQPLENKISIIKKLIEAGVSAKNLNYSDGTPVLFRLVRGPIHGEEDEKKESVKLFQAIMEQLFNGGADIDKTVTIANVKIRPIDYAILRKDPEMVRFLIQNGARALKPTRTIAAYVNDPEINKIIPKQAVK